MTSEYGLQLLYAFGGYIFHLLKMYGESLKRKEVFIVRPFVVSMAANVVAIILLISIGDQLPAELIVMSPLTCVIIGSFGSSMLSGFINVKKPKEMVDDTVATFSQKDGK